METDSIIIKKIQKLLSLANSSNEHEARAAATKANELLIRHNLSLQEVNNSQFDYEKLEITLGKMRLQAHENLIGRLLTAYFFVKVNVGYKNIDGKFQRKISIIGTKENSVIASYIFAFLSRSYPELWKDFRKNRNTSIKDKIPYYHGLTQGIRAMLKATRWKVENETGLLIKSDPKLQEFVKSFSGKSYKGAPAPKKPTAAMRQGYLDGKNINLRKPIESDNITSEVKFISQQDNC